MTVKMLFLLISIFSSLVIHSVDATNYCKKWHLSKSSKFTCPEAWQPATYIYCCGSEYDAEGQRCCADETIYDRDFRKSGWIVLWSAVPFIFIFVGLICFFCSCCSLFYRRSNSVFRYRSFSTVNVPAGVVTTESTSLHPVQPSSIGYSWSSPAESEAFPYLTQLVPQQVPAQSENYSGLPPPYPGTQ